MKRKTKAQREAEEKAALLQRITDIYAGAAGGWDVDEFATADLLSRIMPATRHTFDIGPDDFKIAPWNLGYYDNPELAAEFLYKHGVRA